MPSQSVNTLYCSFSSTGPDSLYGYQKMYFAATGQCINSNVICDQDGSFYVYGVDSQCQGTPSIYSLGDEQQNVNIRYFGNVSAIMYTSILASSQFGWVAYTPSDQLVLGAFNDPTEITGIGFFSAGALILFYIVSNLFPKQESKSITKGAKDPKKEQDGKDSKGVEKKKDNKEQMDSEKEKFKTQKGNATLVSKLITLHSVLMWIVYVSLECVIAFAQNQFVGATDSLQLAKRIFLNLALLSSTIEPVFLLERYETGSKTAQYIIAGLIVASNIIFGGSYYFMLHSQSANNLDSITRWSKAFQVWAIIFFCIHTAIPAWVALNFVAPIKTMTFTDRMHSIRKSSRSLISFTYADIIVLVTYVIIQIVFLGTPALGNDKAVMATFGINFFFYILQYTITLENIEALAVLKVKLRKKKGAKKDGDLDSSKKSISSRPDFAIARRPSAASHMQKEEEKKTKDGKELKTSASTVSLQKDVVHKDVTSSTIPENPDSPAQDASRKQRKSLANPEGLKIITRNNSFRSPSIRSPSVMASPNTSNIKSGNLDYLVSPKETPKSTDQSQKSLLLSPANTRRRGVSLMGADYPMLSSSTKNFDGLEILMSPSRRKSHQEAPSLEIPNGIGRKIDEQNGDPPKFERIEDRLAVPQSPGRRKSHEVQGAVPLPPSNQKTVENLVTPSSPGQIKKNVELKPESPSMSSPGRRKRGELKSVDKMHSISDCKRQTSSLRQEVKNEPQEDSEPKSFLGGNAIFVSDASINNEAKTESNLSPESCEKKPSSFNSSVCHSESPTSPLSASAVQENHASLESPIPSIKLESVDPQSLNSPIPNITVDDPAGHSTFPIQSFEPIIIVENTIDVVIPIIKELPPSQESDNPLDKVNE
ncbi:hypothetical protein HDV06_005513 [Boothiomyces sp. JEL0866]|nr:hypothetical protein HDV06_005513 [Boothiomyces sp. JEL0866]